MRERRRILTSLESTYREAFRRAEETDDRDEMARLDFQFQRDQIRMEVLLDIRELLAAGAAQTDAEAAEPKKEETSLLEKAEALRRLTRLR